MSGPGVGAVTATSFATAVEDPENVRRSRSVGAWLGLTTRRSQSGAVDDDGPISRCGDTHLRGLLDEAATVLLTRTSAESSLRTWGLKLKERIGFKRAAVAVARKLAVVMHAMLRSGQLFRQRTQAINALRGHLAEFGVIAAKGPVHTSKRIAALEDPASDLPQAARGILTVLVEELRSLDERVAVLDREIAPARQGG